MTIVPSPCSDPDYGSAASWFYPLLQVSNFISGALLNFRTDMGTTFLRSFPTAPVPTPLGANYKTTKFAITKNLLHFVWLFFSTLEVILVSIAQRLGSKNTCAMQWYRSSRTNIHMIRYLSSNCKDYILTKKQPVKVFNTFYLTETQFKEQLLYNEYAFSRYLQIFVELTRITTYPGVSPNASEVCLQRHLTTMFQVMKPWHHKSRIHVLKK